MSTKEQLLRQIPQLDLLARRADLTAVLERAGRELGMALLRDVVGGWREAIQAGGIDGDGLERQLAELPASLARRVDAVLASAITPLVNATGVVIHTNLGRSVLAPEARAAMERCAAGYTNLEYDVAAGRRGSRLSHLDRHLERLFPGRAGMAVNNNAGAVLLALNTLAAGREVVVSRGELVEIGGSFRIPDIMARSGAILREVGTTNRTRIADYRDALGERTGLLLKVHPSNYRIVGFAEETSLEELAVLGREAGLPVVIDQGSGGLQDLSAYGVDEPPVGRLLDEGADLVLFSGDKLLGGPQAGLAVGRRDLVEALRRNPMARALRLDKGTLAALEATLAQHVRGTALETLPTLRMIAAGPDAIGARAERLRAALQGRMDAELSVRDGGSVVGGGAWPLGELPTRLLAVSPRVAGAADVERALRGGSPPVVARVEEGRLLVDLRTVLPEEEAALEAALVAACPAPGAP